MKNIPNFVVLLLVLFAAACSNDFEVTAPWKEIPVTHAVLSAKDSFQYIRVEKAFLDPNVGADSVARISDSIYYPVNSITVTLQKANGSKIYPATRVDGNLEGFPRQPGFFATSPNWLYKVNTFGVDSLVPSEKYKIVIKRANNPVDITGETSVPGKFSFVIPQTNSIVTKMGFDTSGVTTLDWRCDANAVFFNANLLVRYREEDPQTGQVIERKTLVWPMGVNVKRNDSPLGSGGNAYRGLFKTASFFRFLRDNIAPTTTVNRRMEDFVLTLEGGGREIEAYLETANANLGITGAEVIPSYTNMSEGFGVVTAKNKLIVPNVRMEPQSLEVLTQHYLTRSLNFKL